MADRLGLVQVYTGNGKGKTTAALGLSVRASGRGLKVAFIQFLKPNGCYGEQTALAAMDNIDLFSTGLDHMCGKEVSEQDDADATSRGVAIARDALTSGRYDLVVLDEVINSVRLGQLDSGALIELVDSRASGVEVVLTGRGATRDIIDYADLVTEMRLVKHPFDRGIGARKGIES